MVDEKEYKLFDLYEKIRNENTAKEETFLKIRYIPNNVEKNYLSVSACLKPTIINDASYCTISNDGSDIYFDLMFKESYGTFNYEYFVEESYFSDMKRFDDEIMKKNYFILVALVNPQFFLFNLDKSDYIKQLLQNDKLIIELIDAQFIIEIYHEKLDL